MATKSGLNGLISFGGTAAFSTVRDWTLTPTNSPATGGASNSGGATFGITGVKDFSGTFNFYSPTTLGSIVPGTAYVFIGQDEASGDEYKGGIIIDEVTYECDIEGGGILSGSASFSSIGSSTAVYTADNNALTRQAASVSLTNSVLPNVESSIGCKADWKPIGQANATDIPGVRSWSLTLRCDNQSYSHSGTGGVTKRVAGRKSASASVQFYDSDLSAQAAAALSLVEGTVGALRLYTAAASYWDIRWGIIESAPMEVPIESAGIISSELSFIWTAYTKVSGTQTAGAIIDPNAVSFFGT